MSGKLERRDESTGRDFAEIWGVEIRRFNFVMEPTSR